jgi:O-acetylhomoserine/O-acetylserine sulfhydrylase-like pyridoxal-dependent enzyme
MTISFGFFTDSGLTAPLVGSILHSKLASVASADQDTRLYFGSAAAGTQLQRATNPGVDDIEVEITDSDLGAAPAATAVKLALSQSALSSAVAGDPLSLGTEILSGSANAVEVWIRTTNALSGVASDSTLGLFIDDVDEVPQP